jgi:hypothetical protein
VYLQKRPAALLEKRSRSSVILFALILLLAPSALAGMENVRFCLHRKPAFHGAPGLHRLCDDLGTSTIEPNYSPNYDGLSCDQYSVTAPLGGSSVYVVVAQAGEEGVGAVSFGVEYDGSDPDGQYWSGDETGIVSSETMWTTCADGLEFPNDNGKGNFPASKGGVRITWASCANQVINNHGVHAVAGCFYVYAYSSTVMSLGSNNGQSSGPELVVANCSGKKTDFFSSSHYPYAILGKVQFGTGSGGYNPCADVVPVRSTSWGKIKQQYR